MKNAAHTIHDEISYIFMFLTAIWAVFFVSHFFFPDLKEFGIAPRTMSGLIGIPLIVFLHGNLSHLLGNTIPLFILLMLLAGSRARSWEIVLDIILLSGSLLWIFGRASVAGNPTVHIGASGLIFGLIAFLILSGFLERRLVPLLIAIAVCFFYGGTLLAGVVPQVRSNVSWDGHLCGAIAGGLTAFFLTRDSEPEKEKENAEAENPAIP